MKMEYWWLFPAEQWLCLQHLHDVRPQDGGRPQAAGGGCLPSRLLPGGRALGWVSYLQIMGQTPVVDPPASYSLLQYASCKPPKQIQIVFPIIQFSVSTQMGTQVLLDYRWLWAKAVFQWKFLEIRKITSWRNKIWLLCPILQIRNENL